MNQQLIKSYVEYLEEKGYSRQTVHAYSKALEQAPDTRNTQVPQELYEHKNDVLKSGKEHFPVSANHNIKPASSLLFLMVSGTTIKEYSRQHTKCSVNDGILNEFYRYSTEFKSMTDMSALAERHHVSEFLDQLGSIPEDWSEIAAEDLRDYVCDVFSKLKPSSVGRYITSLRNFFRFLEYSGIQVNQSVLELPLAPADWNKSNVPVILTADEEARLRLHYDTSTPVGTRNTIIVRLMLDLGLRCAEVAGLELTDIRWNNGTIHLGNTKNNHSRELPIPKDLGPVLENYVINCRSHTDDNHLFQRKTINEQYVAMSRENIRGVVRRAFNKENIYGWWKGTHALRRTAASHIYNTGNSLKMTADLLGHESLDSATQYVKVDFESLRKVSSPWPGGDSDE
jgi:site-specific recombinase XerD